MPVGLEEQVHHAFHLHADECPFGERWEWEEKSGGDIVEHRFAFRWLELDKAFDSLWPSQAMWINAVRISLSNPAMHT